MLPGVEVEQLFAGPFPPLPLQHPQVGGLCPGQARLPAPPCYLHPALLIWHALLLGRFGFFLERQEGEAP